MSDAEGNLKFETALLVSQGGGSATESNQALARVRLCKRWRVALFLGSQGFRPGLGVCRAYGAEFFW